MTEEENTIALNLLLKAQRSGLKVSYDNAKVIVQFFKGISPDKVIIEELRSHRELLAKFFYAIEQHQDDKISITAEITKADIIEGKKCYQVTPFHTFFAGGHQDDTYRFKLFFTHCLQTNGPFAIEVFKKAINYMLARHESLRSTFWKKHDKYYLVVNEDADISDYVVYKNFRCPFATLFRELEEFIFYKNHRFDLSKGPLILFRIAELGNNDFYISLKIDHSIYDAWSLEVLFKEVLVTYHAFLNAKSPELPKLLYQYKDYLCAINLHIDKHYESHRSYWRSLYKDIPGQLLLPGAKSPGDSNVSRLGKKRSFKIESDVSKALYTLSERYSVPVFIALQASFKSFLRKMTNQSDLVIVTIVFGRKKLPDCANQIGVYSRQIQVRTLLEDGDDFEAVVKKVSKSNEDAETYDTCFCIDSLSSGGSSDISMSDFIKFRIQFEIDNFIKPVTAPLVESAIPWQRIPHVYVSEELDTLFPVDIDIELRFYRRQHDFYLDIIYDVGLYDEEFIKKFFSDFYSYLKSLTGVPKRY